MSDCDHIKTTNPELIKYEFQVIYDLSKVENTRSKWNTVKSEYDEATIIFGKTMERKYRNSENEMPT